MTKYLARWDWQQTVGKVEIIKETDSSVWVLEKGKEKRRAKTTDGSMYCPTYKFAVEKIRQELQAVINRDRGYLEHKEKQLASFLEKHSDDSSEQQTK